MSAAPLGQRSDLEALFDELADELEGRRLTAEVVMVGGAWLLWHAHRAATHDVDSVVRLSDEARAAVASRHDLDATWLNDRATAFWPQVARLAGCDTVYDRGGLIVRTPPADVIFLMKLDRGSPQDHRDMVALWPLCTFTDAETAAAAYAEGFPLAPEDPWRAAYIEEIATEARRASPASGASTRGEAEPG